MQLIILLCPQHQQVIQFGHLSVKSNPFHGWSFSFEEFTNIRWLHFWMANPMPWHIFMINIKLEWWFYKEGFTFQLHLFGSPYSRLFQRIFNFESFQILIPFLIISLISLFLCFIAQSWYIGHDNHWIQNFLKINCIYLLISYGIFRDKFWLVLHRSNNLVKKIVSLFVITLSNPLSDGSSISKIKKYFK